jgi:hypothetical protein
MENLEEEILVKERNPKLIICCGRKGVGKTYTTIKMIKAYVKGDPDKGIKGRKVLILDVNDEFTDIKAIRAEDILKFTVHPKVEARRVRLYKSDGTAKSLNELSADLALMMRDFRGGLLLAEDLSKFVGDTPSSDLIGKLCTLRHVDVDIVIHFQGIGRAGNPKYVSNLNSLRLHLVEDSVERHKGKFEEKTEILKIAEALVKNSAEKGQRAIRGLKRKNAEWKTTDKDIKLIKAIENKYIRFYCFVDFDEKNIKGDFTPEQFKDAIFRYISENQNETMAVMLRKIDREGHNLYDKKTAIQALEQELFDSYYGN